MFEQFGELVNVCIMRDDDKKSKEFGFVCFQKSEDAQKALDHFTQYRAEDKENQQNADQKNADESNRAKRLYVCEAKSKQ